MHSKRLVYNDDGLTSHAIAILFLLLAAIVLVVIFPLFLGRSSTSTDVHDNHESARRSAIGEQMEVDCEPR